MVKEQNKESGSFTLEAAICLPPFLLFLAALVVLLFSLRAEFFYQEAAYSALQDFQLLSLLQSAEDLDADFKFHDLPDSTLSFLTEKFDEFFLEQAHEKWFERNLAQQEFLAKFIVKRSFAIKSLSGSAAPSYVYTYAFSLAPDLSQRTVVLPLPYWGGSKWLDERKLSFLEQDEDEVNDVWTWHNFARGKYFQEEYGANLPFTYPVLSKFDQGRATSIKSIDLTAPSYASTLATRKRVEQELQKLADFTGTTNFGLQKITITEEEIRVRELLLVIPSNTPEKLKQELYQIRQEARQKNLVLTIKEAGQSTRYLDDSED